jgi:hypothetical protein
MTVRRPEQIDGCADCSPDFDIPKVSHQKCAPLLGAQYAQSVRSPATPLFPKESVSCFPLVPKEKANRDMKETDVRQGTLALMVLKTLDAWAPAWLRIGRIEQISGDLLTVNQGTLYPVLLKLAQEGSIL